MSMEQLKFYHPQCDSSLDVKQVDVRIMLNIKQGLSIDVEFPLDHNQAHFLYLYLKERFEP